MYILHLSIGVIKREKYLRKQQFKSIIVKCIIISIFFYLKWLSDQILHLYSDSHFAKKK